MSIVSEKNRGVNGAPGGLSALPVTRRRRFELSKRRAGIALPEITQRSGYTKRKPVRVLFRQLVCRREICFDIGLEQEVEISELAGGICVLGKPGQLFVGFEGRGSGVAVFREIRDEAQFKRVARGKGDGVVPM